MAIQVTNTSSQLTGKTLLDAEDAQAVSGVKTFSVAPVVNAGIQFPAVQVAVGNVNTLDDYEEGAFTPIIISSGGGAPTYSLQSGLYIKIGYAVWFRIHVTTATLGTLANGSLTIGTLPFAVAGGAASWVSVSYFGGLTTSMSSLGGALNNGVTAIAMTFVPAAGSGSHSLLAKGDLGGASDLVIGGFYTT